MENPVIRIQQGHLRGSVENSIYGVQFMAFRGIPYANAPVGNLRFKDPEPVDAWSGIRDATQFGNQCPQRHIVSKNIIGNEDCLFLNVYTSDLNPSEPRAVMVWIHGGGFVQGSGNDEMFGPDHFIEKDIVLVTINYRVGVLGFLDLEDEVAPGNQGLKDQVLALKWVKQNISKFGGDLNNVTIFGGGAGGASVHYLTLSPLAEGLFHKAIMQSGVAINPWVTPPHSTMERAQRLCYMLGEEIIDPRELVEFLRTVDVKQLLHAESLIDTWKEKLHFINSFGPTVDSKSENPFMPISTQKAFKEGISVPCMMGYVTHEGLMGLANARLTDDKLARINDNPESLLLHPTLKRFFRERNVSVTQIRKIFMGNATIDRKNIDKLMKLMSALVVTMGMHQVLEIQAFTPHIPTYLYKFEYERENTIMKELLMTKLTGTCHSEELNFLFYPKICKALGQEPPARDSDEHMITRRFIELWTNFAKTGNPTPKTSELIPIEWKPMGPPKEYNCLRISEDLSMIKETNVLFEIKRRAQKMKSTGSGSMTVIHLFTYYMTFIIVMAFVKSYFRANGVLNYRNPY